MRTVVMIRTLSLTVLLTHTRLSSRFWTVLLWRKRRTATSTISHLTYEYYSDLVAAVCRTRGAKINMTFVLNRLAHIFTPTVGALGSSVSVKLERCTLLHSCSSVPRDTTAYDRWPREHSGSTSYTIVLLYRKMYQLRSKERIAPLSTHTSIDDNRA